MKRCIAVLALSLGLLPGTAGALELKNVRPSYGPLGAERKGSKLLPGDVMFMTYEIDGLKFDDKTGKSKFETTLEFIDDAKPKEPLFVNGPVATEITAQLGGTRIPGDVHVIIGPNRLPGKYTIKLTVADKIAKETKSFTYPVEVVAKEFGFVGVNAPTVGFPGQHYMTSFGLVNMDLDKKSNKPNVEVVIKILENGKPATTPVSILLPRDLPDGIDLVKANFVPLNYPLYLNRSGNFTFEITATDKSAGKSATLRFPLTVIDLGSVAGK